MKDNKYIEYEIATQDGKRYGVKKSDVEKYGWAGYAKAFPGAKVRMRDNENRDYSVPIDKVDYALGKNLRPFTMQTNVVKYQQKSLATQPKPESVKPTDTSQSEDSYQPTFADAMGFADTLGNVGGTLYQSEQSRKQLEQPFKPSLNVERTKLGEQEPDNIGKSYERSVESMQYGPDVESTRQKLKNDIKNDLVESRREDSKATMYNPYTGTSAMRSQKTANLEAASAFLDSADMIQKAATAEGGWASDLARGVRDAFRDPATLTFGMSSADQYRSVFRAINKMENGEQLTKDEQTLLDAAAYNMYVAATNNPNLSTAYTVGKGAAESLPFMVEFFVNPISGVGKKAAKELAEYTVKKYAGKAIGKYLTGGLAKTAARKAGKFALGAAANVVPASAMALTTSAPRTVGGMYERMVGEVKPEVAADMRTIVYGGHEGESSVGKALAKSYASTTIENWSEFLGDQFSDILPAVGKIFGRTKLGTKIMDTKAVRSVTDFMDKVNKTDLAKAIKDIEEAVQFNGTFGEFAEEVAGGIANAIVVGDQELNAGERGVFNPDNLIQTYLTCAVIGAVPAGLRITGYAASKLSNRKLKAADAAAGKAMGDSWPQMREQILNASNEARADYLKQVVTSPVFSAEDKKAVLTYVGEVAKREAAEEFKRMKKDDPAYSAYENRKDIIDNYNETSAAIGEEQKSEFDNYANYGDWYLQNKDVSEEKSYDASLYFNARQDMYDYVDEMNARIKSRVDARMQEVDNLTNPDTGEVITVASNYYQQPVNIVGGRLAFDEAGNVDAKASDKIIYYVDNNGKRMMATPDKFTSLVSRASAADMRRQVQQEEEAGAWAEEEVEMSQPEIKVGSTVVTPDGKQGVVTEMNSDYVSVNVDGQSLEYAPSEVSVPIPQQAETAPQPVSGQPEVQQIEQSQIQQQEPEVTTQQEGMAGTAPQPEAQPAEVQQPKPQIPSGQIPQDEKGNYLFTQVPAEQTYAYLNTQEDITPEEAGMIVDQNIQEAQKRIEKLTSNGPKVTPNINEFRKNKAQWEADKQQAQADLDYWNQVKAIGEQMAQQEEAPGDAEAREVMSHTDPLDGEELAAKLLSTGGIKITRDSYLKESGFKPEEARRMFGLFASPEKGGVSIERAGELLELASREEGYNFFPEGEANAGRDAIISVLQQARTKGDLYRFISNRREEQARREQEAAQAAYADFIMRNFGMTVEEYQAYEDMRTQQVLERSLSKADKNAIIEEFISEEPVKQEEDGTAEEQQPISTTSETGGEVLQGEQPVYAGGTGRTETESGEAGGGVVDESGVTPAEEVEEGKITSSGQVGLIRDEMAEGEADADLIDSIAKKLGVTVRFVDQVAGGAANAQIVGNTIEIEKGNENPVKFLLGHEITHRVQDLASDAYQEFKEYTKRVMGEGFDNAVARMKRAYEVAGIPISNEQLEDEVVADFAGSLSENRGALEKFINQSNPTIWQILKDVFESIKSLFVGERERQINEAVRLLDNALKKAEAKANSEGINAGEKFSVKTINKNNVAQKIYETSGLYLKELNKDGVLGRVVGDNGVINIEAAKKEFSVAEDVLNDYIENLENMKGYATNAAKGVIDDQIKEAKNSIEYYKNLAEGKDVWRTETTRFSLRTKPAPKKTVKAYKLMKVDSNGKLHFPFAMVGQEVPLGVWMDAEDASAVNAKGERKATLTFRGGGKGQAAPRPGFHAGDMPYAAHIGIGGNQQQREKIGAEDVWVEAEMAADVDYQQEATENGRNPKTGKVTASKADIRDRVPVDGFYRYKTNPNMKGQWLIGGSMKLNRVLSDQEVNDILDEMGADVQRMPRDGGNQTQEWFDNINKINLSEGQRFSIRMTPEMETIIEEAKANGTYMKAPNGNPTNLTERQWAQVRTKAFKDWFGYWENDPENASKVVDTNGEPKVVYHGTPNRFYEFNPDRGMYDAMYFSDSMALGTLFSGGENITHFSEDAIDILDKADSLDKLRDFGREFLGLSDLRVIKGNGPARVEKEYTTGGNTSSLVYKPGQQDVDVFDRDFADTEEEVIQSIKEDLKSDYEFQESRRGSGMNLATFLNLRNPIVVNAGKSHYSSVEFEGERMSTEQIFREAKDRGNDGVIVRDVVESDGRYRQAVTDYIVSDPAQIKSATDNIGEFSASNPDIRFSLKNTEEMDRIKEAAIADGTFMKAPNGRDTRLSEGQWLQVRTRPFLDWFGDWINDPANASKIVDDNGEPMVVDDVYLNLRDNNPIPSFFSKIERLKKKAEKIKELEKEIGYSWDDREFLDDERAMDIFEYIAYSARNTSTLIESLKEERTPVLRVAFRYGHINEDQMSYNYRDQVFEKGVSVVGRVAELNTEEDPYYSAFFGTQPYNVVLGIDFGRKGADGEMLLTPAMSLGLAKNIGRIAKSAVDNTGYFSTENPDIRFSIKRKENLSSQESDRLKEDIKSIFGSENISESKAVEGLRKLGILNASTYKGYGRISDEQAEYNNSVYRLKDDILKKAVSLFEEKGWDVGVNKNEGVVFFRGSDGIQISFHTRKFPEEWKDLPERSWDMVPKSYSYNPDRYSQVRDYISERYNQWKKDVEAYQGRIKDSMISYLRNSKRRSSLGIEDSYEDIKNKISSYPSRIDSSFNFSDAELISSPISMPYASREQVVKSVESEVGDKPKKFNPEEEVEIAKERFSIKSSYDVFEEVGKSGMKGLLGEQFSDTMIGLHSGLPKKVKDGIYEYSMSRYSDALSNVETASEAISQAISGYLGHMAEESPEASWWEKVCGSVRKNLKDMGVKLNDNDIRYMFWLSNKDRSVLKPEPQPIIPRDRYEEKPISFSEEEIAKLPAMDAVEEVRFSIRMNQTDKESLEQKIKNHKFREGWQDRMISLRDFQEAIAKMSGKKVRDSENAYDFENTVSGIVTYDYENYKQNYMSKITEAIRNLTNGGKADAAARVREYMKAKHGMERNALMRQRAIDKREQEIIKELGGKITPDNQALFDDKMNKKRKAEARTDYAGLTGLYNRLAKPQSKPTMADIEAYMTNLVNDYEKNHDSGKVKTLWDSVRNATGYVLDYLVKTNVMDKEGAEKIKGQYSNYIPLREWQEKRAGDRYTYYSEHGSDAFSNPMIRAEGRTKESGDPLPSIELMALSSFFMGQKNMMKLRLLRLVRNRPSELANVSKVWFVKDATGQWVETVPDISGAKTEEEIAGIIDQFEKDMEAKRKAKEAVQRRSKLDVGMAIVKREAEQHQVRVKELGVDYIINFNMDPSVAQAVNGLNRVNMPVTGFFGWYSKFKRYLTSSMTSYNVDFIPTNTLRDAESSTMNAFIKDGFARLWGVAKNVPKSFYDLGAYIYAGNLSPQLKEFLENGGETGYASLRKYEALRDELEKEISRYKKSNRVKDFFKAFGSILSMINRQIENTMRYATFLASRKAGKSILESIKDAKNSSTNFDRKGSGQMGYVIANQMFFFLNPSIQSLRYKFHLFKEYPIRSTIAHAFWAGMALLIPATCWRGNEETYRSIPEYVRRGNMCIPDGNEGYVTLPLSYDLKPAFVLGDILYGYANGTYKGDEDLAVRDAILAVSEMSPRNFLGGTTSLEDAPSSIVYNFIPDMIGPIADVMRNQTFSGRPIYRNEDYLKYVPEYRKVYKGTPDFMVNASKWLNEAGGGNYATKGSWDYSFLNPAVLEYVFMGYVGGAVPSYWRGFKSAYNKLNEEYVATNDIPIVRRFYKDWQNQNGVPNDNITQRYFDYSEKVRKFESEWNQYLSGMKEPSLSEEDRAKLLEGFPKHASSQDMVMIKSIIQYTDEMVDNFREVQAVSTEEQVKKMEQEIYKVRKDAVTKIEEILKSKEE